jgi:hypothetical protein
MEGRRGAPHKRLALWYAKTAAALKTKLTHSILTDLLLTFYNLSLH